VVEPIVVPSLGLATILLTAYWRGL